MNTNDMNTINNNNTRLNQPITVVRTAELTATIPAGQDGHAVFKETVTTMPPNQQDATVFHKEGTATIPRATPQEKARPIVTSEYVSTATVPQMGTAPAVPQIGADSSTFSQMGTGSTTGSQMGTGSTTSYPMGTGSTSMDSSKKQSTGSSWVAFKDKVKDSFGMSTHECSKDPAGCTAACQSCERNPNHECSKEPHLCNKECAVNRAQQQAGGKLQTTQTTQNTQSSLGVNHQCSGDCLCINPGTKTGATSTMGQPLGGNSMDTGTYKM